MQSGHTDFGQGAYPQQYQYAALSSVASNSGHDMNKPVAAVQQGMYSNAGGMPQAQQHHQSVMGGPSQQAIVQQGQQINRGNHIPLPTFYPRTNTSRSIPNMGRNPLSAVVNQTGQPQNTQFSHVQMVQSSPFHNTFPPMIQFPPGMYPQRTYNPQQYPAVLPNIYMNSWSGYTPPPPPQNSNNFYSSHGISSYQSMPQQMPQQQVPLQPLPTPGKKAIPIIDPNTGEDIFAAKREDSNLRPNLEKETENADPNIVGFKFAAQVAAVALDNRSVPSSKLPIEVRVADSQNVVPCPPQNETRVDHEDSELGEVDSLGELADTESLGETEYAESRNLACTDETPVTYYKKQTDLNSINECVYDNTCTTQIDSVTLAEFNVESVESSQPEAEELVATDSVIKVDSSSALEKPIGFSEINEISNIQSMVEPDSLNVKQEPIQVVSISNVTKEETVIPDSNNESLEVNIPTTTSSKIPDKSSNEGKKNKAKKKKDYNKRGESKEGGEMDAFLDMKEGATVSPVPPPPTAMPTPVPERMPSPVPIVDSEILSTIPLPGETMDDIPQNDMSPSEPTSETSSISPSVDSEDKENTAEEPQNKIVLKYSYKEDQWSPLNPEGKKQYDRDFLLQLQSQPMSLCKPTNLPNLDVIKDKAHIQRLTEVNRVVPQMIQQIRPYNDPFVPVYARGGVGARIPHAPVNRRSQGRGGDKPRKVIAFTSSLNQNIKLHESQNAWKPLHKADLPPDVDHDQLEKDKLKRSVQGVLNKLTPQKFETLLAQLKNLNIDTEDKLALVIDLIFEKAIDEPNFSVPYANLCKHLALIKVPTSGQSGTQVNFRKLLLTKCQKEFEQDKKDEEDRLKVLQAAAPEKQKEMKQEFDEQEKKIRYRQLGNIRFIGELFKLGMLIEPIMHECIRKLLTQADEESLECLCKLLKTIGKELDEVTKGGKGKEAKEVPALDPCFEKIRGIVDKRMTSSRVRFMLQDVIDLRRCNWIPRRDENNPKTIDQIHKEVEREAREQQQVYQNMSSYPKRIPDDRDRRKNASRMGQSEDGWTSSSKSSKGNYSMVDPTKLKLTKPDEVDSIRLGPGGRGLQSWGRGSSGGTKAPSDSDVKTALTNRYSALAEQPLTSNYEGRRGSQRSAASSRESSRGRNSQLPPAIRKTPSTSKERENVLEAVKGLTRPAESKTPEVKKTTDIHVNGKAVESEDLGLKGPDYSEEDMEKKTKPLIDEFLHNNDSEEAIKCVTELASPKTVHIFICSAINQVLERSSQARYSLGQLLYSLLKKKIISFEQYKKGFGAVLEIIDDYALDIPLIWEYMGEILEPMIEDSEFPLKLIKEVLSPCIPSETAGMLVSAILHCAAKRKGTIKLGEVWRESGLQWSDFLGSDSNVNEFITKHKLEFTISPTKVKPKTQMSIEEIKKHLLTLLAKTEESEELFDWIDANVSDNAEANFIRALVTAVHENAISESGTSWELDQTKLKKRTPLLTRYIDHNERLELQALYAVQALMNQLGQPSGLLHQIFDILYDDDVITEETFKEWEQSDDPNEAEGKGVAVHSVKSFFTWLREPEEEADE